MTLDPRIVRLWAVQALIFGAVVLLAGLIASVASGRYWGALLAVAGSAVLVTLMTAYSRAYARTFRAALLDDGLLVHRGVWWRTETFVPRARVQHTDVAQGPLARHFGIATLKVFTAGSQLGQIEVSGLPHADAVAMRDALLGRGDRDGV